MGFFSERTKKKIVIVMGHPNTDADTLSSEVATVYQEAAKRAGHQVRRFDIGDLKFDPVLHKGYKVIQELEPDLKLVQDAIKWADHLVVVYPNWWCTMPALLKGLFDRMWLPGFCFAFHKNGILGHLHMWKRMMKGKTARVFVLSGTHPLLIYMFVGDYTNEIKNGILWFAGFKTKLTRFGPTDHNPPVWKVNEWLRKTERLGKLAE